MVTRFVSLLLLIVGLGFTESFASLRHRAWVIHEPLQRLRQPLTNATNRIILDTRTFSLGRTLVPVVLVSTEEGRLSQPMVVSVSGESTIFSPMFRLNSTDPKSIYLDSEYSFCRSYTYVGPLEISTHGSGEFVYESEFTIVVEAAFPSPRSEFLGILDASLESDFIRAAGGRYVLSSVDGSLAISIGEVDQQGFVFYPTVQRYNSVAIRGTLNGVLFVDVILDTTSPYGLSVASTLFDFFTTRRPQSLHLDIIGYPLVFSKYTVIETAETESLVVVLNPTCIRNIDIMFDASGRIGFRENRRDRESQSV